LYRDLLFELYNGGRTRRKAATACGKVDAGIYRSGNSVFEVQNGGQTRHDLEIEWERLGFKVNETTFNRTNVLTPQSPATHQKRHGSATEQGNQLPLWPLNAT
jgi:hypothetical protein